MKKYMAALLAVCILFSVVTLHYQQKAQAEVMTAALFGAAALAVAATVGLTFEVTAAGGLQNWMSGRTNDWLNGRSLAQVCGGEMVRLAAGALVVPAAVYSAIMDFLDYIRGAEGVTDDGDSAVIEGLDGTLIGPLVPTFDIGVYHGDAGEQVEKNSGLNYAAVFHVYNNDVLADTFTSSSWAKARNARPAGWIISLNIQNNNFHANCYYDREDNNGNTIRAIVNGKTYSLSGQEVITSMTLQQDGAYDPLDVDPGYAWTGEITGVDPTMDLDEVTEIIYDDIEDNVFEVTDAEVIPDSPPTPAPTTPPAEDILEGINDLINQQDTVIEGINDLIDQGDQITDSINDLIDQGDTMIEGVNDLIGQNDQIIEGINDLVENTDGLTDAIDDVATDVAEIAETLDETAEVIQEATEVVDPADAADYKFDLRNLFPFCIPFDVVRILNLFDVSPVAPRVQLPFVIDSLNFSYTFDLDFSAFNSVAAIMRGLEFIVFAIGLAIVTSKVIRW